MNQIADAARAFYEGGQKDQKPLLAVLARALMEDASLYYQPGRQQLLGAGQAWLPVWTKEAEGLLSISFQRLLQDVLAEEALTGILLDPEACPLYLSADILEDLLQRAGLGSRAEGGSLSERALALLEEGDRLRDAGEGAFLEEALSAYREAYALAEREKDDYVYPEICLRLADFHPDLCEKEDLLSLLDEAIARFKRRVSGGDREAPARLVLALRLKEQTQARGDGRMRPFRSIPKSFFDL